MHTTQVILDGPNGKLLGRDSSQFSQIIFKNGGAPVEVQRTWAPNFLT